MKTPRNRMQSDESHRANKLRFPTQDYQCVTCPNCGSARVRVVRSETLNDGRIRKREHRCTMCPGAWSTVQTVPIKDRKDLKPESPGNVILPQTGPVTMVKRPKDIPPNMPAKQGE